MSEHGNDTDADWIFGVHSVRTLVATAPQRVRRLLVA